MTMPKVLFVSMAILSLVTVSACGSNPSNGDAATGAGGKGGTSGVGGQAGTSVGGRGGGGAGATGGVGVAGNGGGAGTTAGRGGGTAGAGGGVAGRGGTGGVAGNGAAGRAGVGGSAGSAGRGGVGGGGGRESCGGQICGQDEFCCGPSACGSCRNNLTGPNCPTSCGGSGGHGGQGGAGGTAVATCPAVPPQSGGTCTAGLNCYYEDCAGAGRTVASCVAGSTVEPRWQVATGACTPVTCPTPVTLTCPAGQLCFITAGGALQVTCGTNTCGTSAISCGCLQSCSGVCSVLGFVQSGITVSCNTCPQGGCP